MQTLPDVVHAAARQFGELEAVVEGPARPTFVDVEAAVAVRARALVASGTEPGDRVGLWAPNGLEWIVLSFAVYAAGAVLVPVNTRFKGDEAAYVLARPVSGGCSRSPTSWTPTTSSCSTDRTCRISRRSS